MTYQTLDQIKEALNKNLSAYKGESTWLAFGKRLISNEKDSASAAYCRIKDKCLAEILQAQSVESVAAALVGMIAELQAQKPQPKAFGHFENAVADALAVFKEDETDPYFRQLISIGGIKAYFGVNLDTGPQDKKHDGAMFKPFNSVATIAFFKAFADFDKQVFANLSQETRKHFAKDILLANKEETFKDAVANFVLAFMQKESGKWFSFSAERIEQFTDCLMKALKQCPGLSEDFNQQLLTTIQTRISLDQGLNPQLKEANFTKNLEVVLSRLDPTRVQNVEPKDTRTLRQRLSDASTAATNALRTKAKSLWAASSAPSSPTSSLSKSSTPQKSVDLYALSSLTESTNRLIEDSTGIDFNAYAAGYKVRLDVPAHGLAKLQKLQKAAQYGKQALQTQDSREEQGMLAAQAKIEMAEYNRLQAMDAPHQARLYCNNIIDQNFITHTQDNAVLLMLRNYLEEAREQYQQDSKAVADERGKKTIVMGMALSAVDRTDVFKSAYIFSQRLLTCQQIAKKYQLTFSLAPDLQDYQGAAEKTLASARGTEIEIIEKNSGNWLAQERQSPLSLSIQNNIHLARQSVNTIMESVAQQNNLGDSSNHLTAYTAADLELVAGACAVLALTSKVAQWLPSKNANEAAQLQPEIFAHQQHIAAALIDKLRFAISGTNAVQRNFDVLKGLSTSPLGQCLPKCPGYPLRIIDSQTEFDRLRTTKGIQEKTTYLIKDSGALYQSDAAKEIRTFQGGDLIIRKMGDTPGLSAELTQELNGKLLELGGYSTSNVALPTLLSNVTQLQEMPHEFFEHNPESNGVYSSLCIPKSSFSMAAYFVLQHGDVKQRDELSGLLIKHCPSLVYDSTRKLLLPDAIAIQYQELESSKHINLPEIRDVLRQLSATLLTVETLKAKGLVDSSTGMEILNSLPANIEAIYRALLENKNLVTGLSGDSKMNALIEVIRQDMVSRYQDLVSDLVEKSEGINAAAQIDERLEKINQFIATHGDRVTKQAYLDKSVEAILKNDTVSLDEKMSLIQRLSGVLKVEPSIDACASIVNELKKKFSTAEAITENYVDYLCKNLNRLKSDDKELLFASLIAEIIEVSDEQLMIEDKIELVENLSEKLGLVIDPKAKDFLIDSILKKFERPDNYEDVLVEPLFKLMAGVASDKKQDYIKRYQAILPAYVQRLLQQPNANEAANKALQLFDKLTQAKFTIPELNYPASQVFDDYLALYTEEKVNSRRVVQDLVSITDEKSFPEAFNQAFSGLISTDMLGNKNRTKMTAEQSESYLEHIHRASHMLLTAYVKALKSGVKIEYDDKNESGLGVRLDYLLGGTVYTSCTREKFIEDQIALHIGNSDFDGARQLIANSHLDEAAKSQLATALMLMTQMKSNPDSAKAAATIIFASMSNVEFSNLLKIAIEKPIDIQAIQAARQFSARNISGGMILIDKTTTTARQKMTFAVNTEARASTVAVTGKMLEEKLAAYTTVSTQLRTAMFSGFKEGAGHELTTYISSSKSNRSKEAEGILVKIKSFQHDLKGISAIKDDIKTLMDSIAQAPQYSFGWVDVLNGSKWGKGSRLYAVLKKASEDLDSIEKELLIMDQKRNHLEQEMVAGAVSVFKAMDFNGVPPELAYSNVLHRIDTITVKDKEIILAKCSDALTAFKLSLNSVALTTSTRPLNTVHFDISIENVNGLLSFFKDLAELGHLSTQNQALLTEVKQTIHTFVSKYDVETEIRKAFSNPEYLTNARMLLGLQKINEFLIAQSNGTLPDLSTVKSPGDFAFAVEKYSYMERVFSNEMPDESVFSAALSAFKGVTFVEPQQQMAAHQDDLLVQSRLSGDEELNINDGTISSEREDEVQEDLAASLWTELGGDLEKRTAFKILTCLERWQFDSRQDNNQHVNADKFHVLLKTALMTGAQLDLTSLIADAMKVAPESVKNELVVLARCIPLLNNEQSTLNGKLTSILTGLLTDALKTELPIEQRTMMLREAMSTLNIIVLTHSVVPAVVDAVTKAFGEDLHHAQFFELLKHEPSLIHVMKPLVKQLSEQTHPYEAGSVKALASTMASLIKDSIKSQQIENDIKALESKFSECRANLRAYKKIDNKAPENVAKKEAVEKLEKAIEQVITSLRDTPVNLALPALMVQLDGLNNELMAKLEALNKVGTTFATLWVEQMELIQRAAETCQASIFIGTPSEPAKSFSELQEQALQALQASKASQAVSILEKMSSPRVQLSVDNRQANDSTKLPAVTFEVNTLLEKLSAIVKPIETYKPTGFTQSSRDSKADVINTFSMFVNQSIAAIRENPKEASLLLKLLVSQLEKFVSHKDITSKLSNSSIPEKFASAIAAIKTLSAAEVLVHSDVEPLRRSESTDSHDTVDLMKAPGSDDPIDVILKESLTVIDQALDSYAQVMREVGLNEVSLNKILDTPITQQGLCEVVAEMKKHISADNESSSAVKAFEETLLHCGLKVENNQLVQVELAKTPLLVAMGPNKSLGLNMNDSNHPDQFLPNKARPSLDGSANDGVLQRALRSMSGEGMKKVMMRVGAALCLGSLFHKFIGAAVLYFSSAMLPMVMDVLRVMRNVYA